MSGSFVNRRIAGIIYMLQRICVETAGIIYMLQRICNEFAWRLLIRVISDGDRATSILCFIEVIDLVVHVKDLDCVEISPSVNDVLAAC